jgi:cell wall assembly regulator SMI1
MMTKPKPMSGLILRLDKWLQAKRPGFYNSLLPGLTDTTIKAFEQRLGFPLPDSLAALYSWRNGQANSDSNFFASGYSNFYTFMTLQKAQT